MVDFSSIPATTLVPFTWVEIANQALLAGPSIQPYKGLLAGYMKGGSATALEPVLVTSKEQAYGLFGAGSQLQKMADVWLENNRSTELWAVPIADPAGTAAASTLTVTGTATAAGTIVIYVGGERYTAAVSSGDTQTTIAASIHAATPASLVATSGVVSNVVTLTSKHLAAFANQIDVRLNYARGEELPAGVTIVVVGFASGAGAGDFSTIWANIPASQFNVIALGENDTTNLGLVATELDDRYQPDRTLEGQAYYGLDETISNLVSGATAEDSKYLLQISLEGVPQPFYEFAAGTAAVAAASLSADPARPIQTLEVKGILAPAETVRHTLSERETLLANGCATLVPDAGGRMRVERLVTTYLTNSLSAPDASFRDVQVFATLSFMRYDLRTQFAAKFPRHKLAKDGTIAGAGQAIVTPSIARSFLGGIGDQWAEILILEDVAAWRDNLVVEINPSDPNRLDIRVSPDLVNQLRVTAVRMEFFV